MYMGFINGKSKLGELALFCYVLWQGLERGKIGEKSSRTIDTMSEWWYNVCKGYSDVVSE